MEFSSEIFEIETNCEQKNEANFVNIEGLHCNWNWVKFDTVIKQKFMCVIGFIAVTVYDGLFSVFVMVLIAKHGI